MPALTELLTQWQEDLASWAIPAYLTAAVPDSPWVLPRQVFARRADRLRQAPAGPSYQRAWQTLDPPGSVLDVGAGAGAACLPLAPRTTTLTAVDTDHAMLDLLAERARAAGLEPRLLAGGWPEMATQTAPADVVTCHNVLYNVPDLGPFIEALTAHARRQVVVELTAAHPLTSLNRLWRHFHGLDRPAGPTASHVLAILDAMGLRAGHTEWNRPAEADYATVRELAEVTRRRLCLPAERTAEVEAALRDTGFQDTGFQDTGFQDTGPLDTGLSGGQATDLGTAGRTVVTIWWEGSA